MTDVMQDLTAQVAGRIAADFDALLQKIILKKFGIEITKDNAHEFRGRGACATSPDNTEVYSWDGVPFLKTWPATTGTSAGHIIFNQKYQEL